MDSIGLGKYATVLNYGCQMNVRDAEIISGLVTGLGFTMTDQTNLADLILVNTCCVRESAEQKIFGKLHALKKLRKEKPNLLVGVCGCLAQKDGEGIRKRVPHINFVLGTGNLQDLPELVVNALAGQFESRTDIETRAPELEFPSHRDDPVRAWVTIGHGCDNFCSYCIVPYVRGRERSRTVEAILQEVTSLAEQGYGEVTLLGQNVNSYGKDLVPAATFAELLTVLDQHSGIPRVRFMTSHPRDLGDDLIRVVASKSSVCEHIHLPVQSGSNRILQLMNRGYGHEEYLRKVEQIRTEIPDCGITTDIIVGFPGETEEDFADTLDLVSRAHFDAAYTFLYSIRSGTPAAEMPDQIPEEIKKERLNRLMAVQEDISLAHNRAMVGRVEEVLIEGVSKGNDMRLSGRTRNGKLVNFSGNVEMIGQMINLRITAAKTWNLIGEREEGPSV